ncbi:hypothetical protein MIND_00211700 [Mycena indigotica]|uniref:Uncharacterized protein n=1 Tax=Mycena indigotica TaxID=2126181 RepID=A0A8H6T585_9AGAR|nr:uncharacterized protein MIND_00211700 [Mycena indigotica]KAF7311998.1 hypothetical protein MIND_00211700 [Mycena indigotica]
MAETVVLDVEKTEEEDVQLDVGAVSSAPEQEAEADELDPDPEPTADVNTDHPEVPDATVPNKPRKPQKQTGARLGRPPARARGSPVSEDVRLVAGLDRADRALCRILRNKHNWSLNDIADDVFGMKRGSTASLWRIQRNELGLNPDDVSRDEALVDRERLAALVGGDQGNGAGDEEESSEEEEYELKQSLTATRKRARTPAKRKPGRRRFIGRPDKRVRTRKEATSEPVKTTARKFNTRKAALPRTDIVDNDVELEEIDAPNNAVRSANIGPTQKLDGPSTRASGSVMQPALNLEQARKKLQTAPVRPAPRPLNRNPLLSKTKVPEVPAANAPVRNVNEKKKEKEKDVSATSVNNTNTEFEEHQIVSAPPAPAPVQPPNPPAIANESPIPPGPVSPDLTAFLSQLSLDLSAHTALFAEYDLTSLAAVRHLYKFAPNDRRQALQRMFWDPWHRPSADEEDEEEDPRAAVIRKHAGLTWLEVTALDQGVAALAKREKNLNVSAGSRV